MSNFKNKSELIFSPGTFVNQQPTKSDAEHEQPNHQAEPQKHPLQSKRASVSNLFGKGAAAITIDCRNGGKRHFPEHLGYKTAKNSSEKKASQVLLNEHHL